MNHHLAAISSSLKDEDRIRNRQTRQLVTTDLESLNGSFVNVVPIKEYLDDYTRCATFSFLFLVREVEVGTVSVQFEEDDLITRYSETPV